MSGLVYYAGLVHLSFHCKSRNGSGSLNRPMTCEKSRGCEILEGYGCANMDKRATFVKKKTSAPGPWLSHGTGKVAHGFQEKSRHPVADSQMTRSPFKAQCSASKGFVRPMAHSCERLTISAGSPQSGQRSVLTQSRYDSRGKYTS